VLAAKSLLLSVGHCTGGKGGKGMLAHHHEGRTVAMKGRPACTTAQSTAGSSAQDKRRVGGADGGAGGVPNTGGAAGDGCGRQVQEGPEREGPCVRCRLWGMQGRTARWQRRCSRQAGDVLQETAVVGNCRQANMKTVSSSTVLAAAHARRQVLCGQDKHNAQGARHPCCCMWRSSTGRENARRLHQGGRQKRGRE